MYERDKRSDVKTRQLGPSCKRLKMESNQKELGERGWVTGSKVVRVFVQSDGCLESDLTGSNTNYYDRHLGEKVKEGKINVKLHARMKND